MRRPIWHWFGITRPKTQGFLLARLVQQTGGMDRLGNTLIDVAEAAYDLQLGPSAWLPNLLSKGAPFFDQGLGCAGSLWAGQSDDGRPMISQLCVEPGPPDLALRFAKAASEGGPELTARKLAAQGVGVRTASESTSRFPTVIRALEKHIGCKDVLGVWAVDSELHGVGINIPSPERVALSKKNRRQWHQIAIHIATGHRLRRGLGCMTTTPCADDVTEQAEALIDPKDFTVAHAVGRARDKGAMGFLRATAKQLDTARGALRTKNPDEAMRLWNRLVRGRCSLVDWFDSDGRRYMVVIPNGPQCRDPRGLSERELEVALLAAKGASSKAIGYELGVSRQRVSALLKSVMLKLHVKTQPQLVHKMCGFRPGNNEAA